MLRPWNIKASTGYGYDVVLALVPIHREHGTGSLVLL
jgi:hypothetical protein